MTRVRDTNFYQPRPPRIVGEVIALRRFVRSLPGLFLGTVDKTARKLAKHFTEVAAELVEGVPITARKHVVGIEITRDAVRACHMARVLPNQPTIAQLVEVKLEPDAIVDGNVLGSEAVRSAVMRARQQLLAGGMPPWASTIVAVSGHSVIIKDVMNDGSPLPRLAEQHMPFDSGEMVVSAEPSEPGRLLLAAVKSSYLREYLEPVEQAGFCVRAAEARFFAMKRFLCEGMASETPANDKTAAIGGMPDLDETRGSMRAVALVDVGEEYSSIGILGSIFTRDVHVGLLNLEKEVRRTGSSSEEARAALFESHPVEAVLAARSAALEMMAGEFAKSFFFYLAAMRSVDLTHVYVSGPAARVPGLLNALEQRLEVPVKLAVPSLCDMVDRVPLETSAFIVPIGLALRQDFTPNMNV